MENGLTHKLLPISIFLFLRLCFVCGASLGIVAAPFYVWMYGGEGILNAATVILLTPLVNGVLVAVYGLVGYPVYRYLWKTNRLGFQKIVQGP